MFVNRSKRRIAIAVKEAEEGITPGKFPSIFLVGKCQRFLKTGGRDSPVRPSMHLAYSGWWMTREGKNGPNHLGKA